MFRVTNKSFEGVITKRLSEMDSDELLDACEKLGATVAWRIDPKTRRRLSIDRLTTTKNLTLQYTFSVYMGDSYWTERQIQRSEEDGVMELLKKHTRGDETFQLMADFGVGFHKLEPGESVDVDFTRRWVEDELMKLPMSKFLKVEDLEKDEEVEQKETDLKGYDKMSWQDLMKEGKERGVFEAGMKKEELLLALLESDEKQTR